MIMRIKALTTFRHDDTKYEEGERYWVKRRLGWYFIAVGWAKKGGK